MTESYFVLFSKRSIFLSLWNWQIFWCINLNFIQFLFFYYHTINLIVVFVYLFCRAGDLRYLKLTASPPVTPKGLVNAVMKLQFLEHVEISHFFLQLDLKPIGYCCPLLKTLKLSRIGVCWGFESDSEALAIAETMPQLRHLELLGNFLTNTGLKAILENCIRLQHFDLRDCPYVNLVGGSWEVIIYFEMKLVDIC